jgi:hypothetical protein
MTSGDTPAVGIKCYAHHTGTTPSGPSRLDQAGNDRLDQAGNGRLDHPELSQHRDRSFAAETLT